MRQTSLVVKNNICMHIGHVVSTYPPYQGGMGNVAFEMVGALVEKGHKITVFTPDYSKAGAQSDEGGVIKIKPLFKYGNAAYIPKLYAHLKNVDIIHLHYPFFGGAETVARFKKNHPGIPLVITYHMDVEGKGLLRWFFRFYNKFLFPKIIKTADTILVSSLDYAKHSNLLKVKEFTNIVELPFGAHHAFKPGPDRVIDNEVVNLLFVGALDKAHYFKGLKHLIDSIKFIKADLKHANIKKKVILNIVGDGKMRPQYERQAANSGIDDNIVFQGKLSDRELIAAYQNADLTILPSVDRSEAFGLVLVESMACGTPVIASDLPGVRSVVDPGNTGILIPPKNKLELASQISALIKNPERLKKMRSASYERVEKNYRWPIIVEKLEEIYQKLLKQS